MPLDTSRPILIRSADDFRRERPFLDLAAENIRLARLAGSLHLIVELLASSPLLAGAELYCSIQAGDMSSRGQMTLLIQGSEGFEIPARSALGAFEDAGIDFLGYAEARSRFDAKDRIDIARLQHAAEALWAPALACLTATELSDALPPNTRRLARGPGAADIANQWGFSWLAAQIERMQLDSPDVGAACGSSRNAL